jgi:hypothetical protein
MLAVTAEVMGTELSAPALSAFVNDLIVFPDEVIERALVRCRREIRGKNGFPPTLTIADVLDRVGVVSESEVECAEWRAAWDVTVRYADKYITSDAEGGYGEKRYFGGKLSIPELPPQIRDTVRRIGGWHALKCMNNDDFPFVQKRFCEEYRAWEATEVALSRKAVAGIGGLGELLGAKTMPQPKRTEEVRAESAHLLRGSTTRTANDECVPKTHPAAGL